jgi:hypothetical protein
MSLSLARDAERREFQMNTKDNTPNRHPIGDVLASHVDDFLSDLIKAGYPANTLSAKRAASQKFINWRRSRNNTYSPPDESEVEHSWPKPTNWMRPTNASPPWLCLDFWNTFDVTD